MSWCLSVWRALYDEQRWVLFVCVCLRNTEITQIDKQTNKSKDGIGDKQELSTASSFVDIYITGLL